MQAQGEWWTTISCASVGILVEVTLLVVCASEKTIFFFIREERIMNGGSTQPPQTADVTGVAASMGRLSAI